MHQKNNKERTKRLILQNIPGIGANRANLLLNKFGSLEAVFQADEEELKAVEGIGNYTAQQIQWAFKDEACDYCIDSFDFI